MKNEGEIRWLQLSDLHIFDSANTNCQTERLPDRFRKTIDFIVITGDLHQHGEDYSLTLHFLNQLTEELDIEKKDVFIVPGNHDVFNFDGRKELLKDIKEKTDANEEAYYGKLDELYSGFTQYCDFLHKFYGSDRKGNPLENTLHIWNNEIALLCMNTALVSDEDHDKKQLVDIRGLCELKNDRYPCIAIMHHNYHCLADSHMPFVNHAFESLGVSAVLSGHEHKSFKKIIELPNGEQIKNYCCGKSISQPGDTWSDIEVIEYRWQKTGNRVNIYSYNWNPNKPNFMPSTTYEDYAPVINGYIILEQHFTWRNFTPDHPRLRPFPPYTELPAPIKSPPHTKAPMPKEIPASTESPAPRKLPAHTESPAPRELPTHTEPPAPRELPAHTEPLAAKVPTRTKPKPASTNFKKEYRLMAISALIALALAVIVWNIDHPAGNNHPQPLLRYAGTSDDSPLVFKSRKKLHEARLQATGQIIVTVKDQPVETYIIDGMYRPVTNIHDNTKMVLEEYTCPLADSCIGKLEEELERLSVLYDYAKEDLDVKKAAFLYLTGATEHSDEGISHYYLFDGNALTYLDNETANAKMYGVALTHENWDNPEEQEKILADMRNHVLAKLRETQTDY